MIIARSGYGILTLAIIPASGIAAGIVASRASQQEIHIQAAACLGVMAGSIINWFVGRRFNCEGFAAVVDRETALPIRVPQHHELYWIPMEYWSIPAFLGAAAVLVRLLVVHGVI
jgi:membrane protein DedA with SNARE-associated domain